VIYFIAMLMQRYINIWPFLAVFNCRAFRVEFWSSFTIRNGRTKESQKTRSSLWTSWVS